MRVGELWQHRISGQIARIEMSRLGLLSFSVLRDGQWVMCQHVWDEKQFRAKFEQKHLDS